MLKTLVKQLVEQVKAKDVFAAMKTLASILEKSADTGKLLFGAAAVECELEAEFEELTTFRGELMRSCSCGDGSCVVTASADGQAVDPTLILAIVDLVLKLIASRRKK